MSETFPFGTAVSEPPAPAPPEGTPVEPEDEPRSRRTLVLALALVAALVVGAAAWLLLSGGDEEPAPVAAPRTDTAPVEEPVAPETAPEPPVLDAGAPVRDPFAPLVAAEPEGAAGETAGDPAPAAPEGPSGPAGGAGDQGGNTVPGTGSPATGGSTSGGSSTGGGAGKDTPPAATVRTLEVVDVAAGMRHARVTVDGRAYTVAPREGFASGFYLRGLWDGKCGVFRYDGGTFFDLCEGQSREVGKR